MNDEPCSGILDSKDMKKELHFEVNSGFDFMKDCKTLSFEYDG